MEIDFNNIYDTIYIGDEPKRMFLFLGPYLGLDPNGKVLKASGDVIMNSTKRIEDIRENDLWIDSVEDKRISDIIAYYEQ